MEKECVVVLVSAQTIPNVLFLKWCLGKMDVGSRSDLLFVTTTQMEALHKSDAIFDALGVGSNDNGFSCTIAGSKTFNRLPPVMVDENDIENVNAELQKLDFSAYSKVMVSITGGTKLMSMAGYQFFAERNNAEVYYQPINKPMQMLCPEHSTIELNEQLSIAEYFAACGIKIGGNRCGCEYVKDWEHYNDVLQTMEYCTEGRKLLTKLQQDVPWFRNQLKNKGYIDLDKMSGKVPQEMTEDVAVANMAKAVLSLGFSTEKLSSRELKYITGGWFEEYVCQRLIAEREFKAGEQIALNLEIKTASDVPNELDVVYVDSNNRLHIIECKSALDQKKQSDLLNNTIYKIQALKKNFGLTVKSHLYTMSVIDKESVLKRAKDFDIDIVDSASLAPPTAPQAESK